MTNEIREQISAFVDNELSEAEAGLLIRRLGADAELRAEAARMVRLSQRVRGEHSWADEQFASRVLAAIHDEPTLAAVPAGQTAAAGAPQSWLRMVAGGGIVAAVAVLAINALPDRAQTLDTGPDTVAAAVDTAALERTDAQDFEYVTPAEANDSGLVSANPELAAYFLSHTASGPSLAPGSGRVRMLGGDAMTDNDSDSEESAE